ncbi:MAG: hypothetical protein KKD05_08035 [Candidatus Omnitrophica bacterium]|nr:hypothetical protein [Candidatus Omnitrophota bacterium]
MNDNRIKSLYFLFTFILCACAGLSAEPLIGKIYLAIFCIACALGITFSSQVSFELKKNLRKLFGWILLIALPVFFWKFTLQQSALPNLIRVFILLIIAGCFIIENPSALSLVHFECIFITIFSACLPFIIHPRYQVALFGLGLFVTVLLLQITQISASSENQASQYVISNVSITRRFILSFIISLLIVGIGTIVFFIVPKYSFQLDLDWGRASLVDFKLKPKSNLRLMMPYQGGEKELSQAEVVPYLRSLFIKPEKAENLMLFKNNKWKQPLIIKDKKKEEIIETKIKDGNNQKGLVSEGMDISPEDENEIISKAAENLESKLKTQIKDLKAKIAKQKKLYNLISFLGKDDPLQAGKAKEIGEQIKKDLQELSRLNNELKQNQGRTADMRTLEKQGSAKNKDNEKANSQGNDSGDQGAGEGKEGIGEGDDGVGDGTGFGEKGTGEGEAGSVEGEVREESGQGIGETNDQDIGESGQEPGKDAEGEQGQKQDSPLYPGDDKTGQTDSKTGLSGDNQSENKANDNQANSGNDPSDQRSESDEKNDSADSFQNKSSEFFESGDESDQANEQSDKFKDSEDNEGAKQKTSPPDLDQNNGSEQKEVNDGKGDSKGAGGGTNLDGSGSGGGKSGTQGKSSGSGGNSGEGKGDSGSGGSGSSGGQSNQAGSGGNGGGESGTDGAKESAGQGSSDGVAGEGTGAGGEGHSPGGSESAKEKKTEKDPKNLTITNYLFRFENKPLSEFRKRIALIAKGNKQKKEFVTLPNNEQSKQANQNKHKVKKKTKQEEPEILVKQLDGTSLNNNFFWHLFVFFAVLFCGGICWAVFYLIFCVFRKIFRDLKLRYYLIFKLNRISIYLFYNLLFVFKKIGVISHEFLTPQEISAIVAKKYNLSEPALQEITREFEKSRYSNHPISKNNIKACINAYNQLKIDILKNNTLRQKIMLSLDMLSIKSGGNHDL